MVEMRNITLKDNRITMDCFKEGDEKDHFSMVLTFPGCEIVYTSLRESSVYAVQARGKIRSLVKQGSLPKEAISVWY